MSEDIPSLDGFTSLVDDGGVLKKVVKEGHTDISPFKGETVVVHYVGFYHGGDEHGNKFDSSRDRNEPLKYKSEEGKYELKVIWARSCNQGMGYRYADDETRGGMRDSCVSRIRVPRRKDSSI